MSDEERIEAVVTAFFRLTRTIAESCRRVDRTGTLTPAEWRALGAIEREPGIGASALAERLAVSRSAAAQLIGRLQRKGLVERLASPSDRRSVSLRLTPTARTRLERFRATLRAEAARRFGQLAPHELALLEDMLDRLGRER